MSETIEERIRRVSLGESLERWSRAARYHARRGERATARASAKHVGDVLDRYGWEHARPGLVFLSGGKTSGLHQITRVGGRGAIYGKRLRADGSVSQEKQLSRAPR